MQSGARVDPLAASTRLVPARAPAPHALLLFQRPWRHLIQESVSQQRQVLLSLQLWLLQVLAVPLSLPLPLPEPLAEPLPLLLQVQVCTGAPVLLPTPGQLSSVSAVTCILPGPGAGPGPRAVARAPDPGPAPAPQPRGGTLAAAPPLRKAPLLCEHE